MGNCNCQDVEHLKKELQDAMAQEDRYVDQLDAYHDEIKKLRFMLDSATKVVQAAVDVLTDCDMESEKERGFCMGHGGCYRLPCEYDELRKAIKEFNERKAQ